MAAIRITLEENFQSMLESLKKDFPLLKYPEIIRLAVGDFYTKRQEFKKHEQFQKWNDSLPLLHLSDEEQKSLTQGIQESEKNEGKIMTNDELWKSLS
jgi:hypothetical protein